MGNVFRHRRFTAYNLLRRGESNSRETHIMNKTISKILAVFAFLFVAFASEAASVHLSVTTPRGQRTIGVGDRFYISYEVSNTDARPPQPSSIPGAKVLYFERTGQSSSYTSINGVTSQSRSVTYTLTARAEKEGKFTFGPVSVGGVKSNSVSYTIGKTSASAASNQSAPSSSATPDTSKPKFIGKGDGNLFLRASVSKTSAFEQEALVYTVKLYTTYDGIKFIGATSAPKFEGFVVEESKATSVQLSYENYQGRTYATAIIARYIIFPQMKGTLKVIGNTYTVSVDQREYYHDPFWGNMSVSSPLQLNVTPNDLQIQVKGLPQPQPADFSGGVGQFSISSSFPQTALKTNQGASLVYTVKGTGNLKYVKLPDLNSLFPSQLEVYSPEVDVKTTVGATNVSGSATFDYTLIPLEEGEFKIPVVSLCYFNPTTGKYERAEAKGYSVTVGKGTSSDKSQTRDRLRFDSDLMPVADDISTEHTPMIYEFGYWLWYIVPTLLLLSTIIINYRRRKELSDIEGMKARRAAKIARKRLKKAYECLQRNDSAHFYDEMLRALWGYIAHKLKMPTSELTRQNIKDRLENCDVPANLIKRILGLLDDCEFAKYTPVASGFNMKDLYQQAESVVLDLEDAFRKKIVDKKEDEPAMMTISEKLDRDLDNSPELKKDVASSIASTSPGAESTVANIAIHDGLLESGKKKAETPEKPHESEEGEAKSGEETES